MNTDLTASIVRIAEKKAEEGRTWSWSSGPAAKNALAEVVAEWWRPAYHAQLFRRSLLDTVNRRVVGVVTAIASQDAHGRMAETAFITPVETLRMICPQLTLSDVQPYQGMAKEGLGKMARHVLTKLVNLGDEK